MNSENRNDSQDKICKVCGIEFARKSGLSDKVWKARVCCSRKCGNIYRQNPNAPKSAVARRKDPKNVPYYSWNETGIALQEM